VDNPQYILHSTTGTDQFQATALTAKGNIRTDYGANARTVQLRDVLQVQQQLLHALGDELFQMNPQQVAVNADYRSSMKVQNSDIS